MQRQVRWQTLLDTVQVTDRGAGARAYEVGSLTAVKVKTSAEVQAVAQANQGETNRQNIPRKPKTINRHNSTQKLR